MARYAAFLRAVNVGNFMFSERGSADLQARIRAAMQDEFGFGLTTFLRTAAQVEELVSATPFGSIEPGHTYFGLFTLTPLTAAERRAVEAMSNERDEVVVVGRDVPWLIRAKSMATSLGRAAGSPPCPATRPRRAT